MSHNARICNDRRICQICKKKHPTGLHGYTPKQKAGDDNSSASDGTQKNVTFKSNCAKFDHVSCSASCSDKIVSMCIVPVKIVIQNIYVNLNPALRCQISASNLHYFVHAFLCLKSPFKQHLELSMRVLSFTQRKL